MAAKIQKSQIFSDVAGVVLGTLGVQNFEMYKCFRGPRGVVLSTLGYKICPKALHLLWFLR